MFAPKNILVPTDFTSGSDRALREAVEIAKQFQSKVFLIHIDNQIPEAGGDYALSRSEIEAAETRDVEMAHAKMHEEIGKVMKAADVQIAIAERHGKTHEEILGYSTENKIDLILIEPHPKKSLLKSLVGGVADKLIHQAHCPVLVLH